MNNALVSVVVPVYNEIEFLKECVESLKNQTYKNLEIIFVDDCSTDGSGDFLDDFAKTYKKCKVIHHQENKCTFVSRVDAFKACDGDYITFLDGDDTLPNDYIEKLVDSMQSSNADICIADCIERYPENDRRAIVAKSRLRKVRATDLKVESDCFANLFVKMLNDKYYVLWSKMLSKNLITKCLTELEDFAKEGEGISYGEDFIFSTILYFYSKKVINTHDTFYNYRFHDNQSIVFSGEEKYRRQIISFLKSAKFIKTFLKNHGIFEKYSQNFGNWFVSYKNSFESSGFKYKHINVFRKVIKEYKEKYEL